MPLAPESSRWFILFPASEERLFDLRKHGFNRLFQNGRTFEFSTPESLLETSRFSLSAILVYVTGWCRNRHQRPLEISASGLLTRWRFVAEADRMYPLPEC